VTNYTDVDDALSVLDGVHNPIVPYAYAPQIRRTSEFPRTYRPGLCRETL